MVVLLELLHASHRHICPTPVCCTGTLYVFITVCASSLYMRLHSPGSGSTAAPVLLRILAMVLASLGELSLVVPGMLLLWATLDRKAGSLPHLQPPPTISPPPTCPPLPTPHRPAAFSLAFTLGAPWPACLALLLACAGAALALWLLPVVHMPEKFKAPFFPWTPCLGILLTVCLMCSLGWPAYLRFGIWMLLGLGIYAAYGVHGAEARDAEHRRYGGRLLGDACS